MAAGTFILRPSADVSNEHSLYPSDSAAAYLLINESVADDASTYLYCSQGGNGTNTCTSVFKVSGAIPAEKIKITDIKVYCRTSYTVEKTPADPTLDDVSLALDNVSASASWDTSLVEGEYTTLQSVDFDSGGALKNAINAYLSANAPGSFPDLELTLVMTAYGSGGEGAAEAQEGSIRTTQMYLELTYEENTGLGIHKKVNGQWKQAQKAYKKVSGAWTEITEAECKTYLQSSVIRS